MQIKIFPYNKSIHYLIYNVNLSLTIQQCIPRKTVTDRLFTIKYLLYAMSKHLLHKYAPAHSAAGDSVDNPSISLQEIRYRSLIFLYILIHHL